MIGPVIDASMKLQRGFQAISGVTSLQSWDALAGLLARHTFSFEKLQRPHNVLVTGFSVTIIAEDDWKSNICVLLWYIPWNNHRSRWVYVIRIRFVNPPLKRTMSRRSSQVSKEMAEAES